MKEHKIILPLGPADSGEFASAHTFMSTALLRLLGGYTTIPCSGAWKDANGIIHRDESLMYIVAHGNVNKDHLRDRMRDIAITAGEICGQQCVYTVNSDGVVSMYNTPLAVKAATQAAA